MRAVLEAVGYVRLKWDSILGASVRMSVLQNNEAISYVIESYCLGMCVVVLLLFFLDCINKQIQHKLVLCCWFLFSISWGLFAF